ncbi:DEAD/DEAH box helicase family protein [Histomonas meleagridis]|uniref:DEAD/DEAH box helicase family protein n=1 Tax=Histomonas meleagridis TaxID=135588 RepID=UPI00355A2AF0|nr:DEAD/DEAH box helicase family protein [Histomonas meleagridis]KAH0799939.1 DEAD/DEAH box helicase family protein [Histomonas meleagridis]
METQTFADLGLCPQVCEAVADLGWKVPTEIQASTIPKALKGEDVAGMAKTGSGKTGAYLLPLIHRMIEAQIPPKYAVILAPTRELVLQISEVCQILCKKIKATIVTAYGGMDDVEQMALLAKEPNIIIATPGRLSQLLTEAHGFNLSTVHIIVVDEADQMAGVSFYDDIRIIIRSSSHQRQLLLFSATMPQSVERLAELSISDTSFVKLGSKEQLPTVIEEEMIPVHAQRKEATLATILDENRQLSVVVFCSSCRMAEILTDALKNAGFSAGMAHGKMTQPQREEQISMFRTGEIRILVSTNVAARGIDIPNIDLVINYDLPPTPKEYVHRCGRAGRAGRKGAALTFVTLEDKDEYLKIEKFLRRKLKPKQVDEKKVLKWVLPFRKAKDEAVEKYKIKSRSKKQ